MRMNSAILVKGTNKDEFENVLTPELEIIRELLICNKLSFHKVVRFKIYIQTINPCHNSNKSVSQI